MTQSPHPTLFPTPKNTFQLSDYPLKPGWLLAKGTYFSIAYPSDWLFTSPVWSDTNFSETFSITSPSHLSSIQVGTKYSFPFGGPLGLIEQQKSTMVTVGTITYQGINTSYGKSEKDMYSEFTSVTLTDKNVQFTNKNNMTETEPILILFGNDYPLSPRNQNTTDQQLNYYQYVKEKPMLLQILSTFKFSGQESTQTMIPADSQTPAAEACPSFEAKTVAITLNTDTPSPKCVKIYTNQSLNITNGTNGVVQLDFANIKTQLPPHGNYLFPNTISHILAQGVHILHTSLYGGNEPEIWILSN